MNSAAADLVTAVAGRTLLRLEPPAPPSDVHREGSMAVHAGLAPVIGCTSRR
ncbi:hypothetical protein AB0H77_05890 [Streptomyces sp. NPDC050844]|uniref:hypothetical protein n=1 Tax=Streptomyces sp. NPDC050844 TaxID=3155790 RepID=UPI0033E63256